MEFIYTLFIALANNVDNISVRIAYSIGGIKKPETADVDNSKDIDFKGKLALLGIALSNNQKWI